MLVALLLIQIFTLIALAALLLRSRSASVENPNSKADPRLDQLLSADLPTQFTRLDARSETLDQHLRGELSQLRTDSAAASASLRGEVLSNLSTLGDTLRTGLENFRADNTSAADRLRSAVDAQLAALSQRLTAFTADSTRHHNESREALQTRLDQLRNQQTEHQDKLRAAIESRLEELNQSNAAKLEEMRRTVDEKLESTLHTRLTQSFGLVTTHLGEVQKGLGEMKELAAGVGDLKKVFSSVSARGNVGEFLVEQQLKHMFSPEQYECKVTIKPDTRENVEFALKIPGAAPGDFSLLPIDSKFPTSDWERLVFAYEQGTKEELATAGKAFERQIRAEAQKICEKYIYPPKTLPHAIMVLPTEGLYAEVVRRPGLQSQVQEQWHVTIAGPSTFMAILTSFQLGFNSLTYLKKSDEIGRILSEAKHEFGKFGDLMEKVGRQVGTVQNTLKEIGGKTKTINYALRNVASLESGIPGGKLLAFDEPAGLLADIAAASEED